MRVCCVCANCFAWHSLAVVGRESKKKEDVSQMTLCDYDIESSRDSGFGMVWRSRN